MRLEKWKHRKGKDLEEYLGVAIRIEEEDLKTPGVLQDCKEIVQRHNEMEACGDGNKYSDRFINTITDDDR